jgi:hypothetical protein
MSFTVAKRRTLALPYEGKIYEIPAPSAKIGLYLNNLQTVAAKQARGEDISEDERASLTLDDSEEQDLHRQVFGTAYQTLVEDLDYPTFELAFLTVLRWVTQSREAAEAFWNETLAPSDAEGGDPKATSDSPDTETPARPGSPASSKSTSRKRAPGTRGRTSSTRTAGRS